MDYPYSYQLMIHHEGDPRHKFSTSLVPGTDLASLMTQAIQEAIYHLANGATVTVKDVQEQCQACGGKGYTIKHSPKGRKQTRIDCEACEASGIAWTHLNCHPVRTNYGRPSEDVTFTVTKAS